MNILFITHFFPPKHNAGTENYTAGLAQTFSAKGHDVQVLCAEDWQSGPSYWNGVTKETYKGVPVHRIHLNWAKSSNPNRILYDSVQVENWLGGFLGRLKPDLVHVTSIYSLGVGTFRAVKHVGIPLVLTLTDFWFICPSIQLLHNNGQLCNGKTTAWECQACLSTSSQKFQKLNLLLSEPIRPWVWEKLAQIPLVTRQRGFRGMLLDMLERKQILTEALAIPDRVFSPSIFVQQMFAENSLNHIEVLRHGHDLSWLQKYNGKTKSNLLRFGYIGQIQTTKGVHVLVEAFQRARLDRGARLDIWGSLDKDNDYTHNLEKLIGNSRSIKLRGRFQRDNLAEVLADIDVLVVPSLWYENAPLVIQEAFATKTPVIATNLGGMAEAVTHEGNGLLFERNDVADLAKQMQRVINEPSLLTRLQAGIPSVKTIEAEVDQLEMIYQELVG